MRVILSQDIPTLGRKNEVKEVRDGYARNFLLPKNLARPATAEALKLVAATAEKETREKLEEHQKHQKLTEQLGTIALTFAVKVGEKGRAFGSVTAVKIRDALRREGIAVEKEWILLEEPIKATGEHVVRIKFPHEVEGQVKIIVTAE